MSEDRAEGSPESTRSRNHIQPTPSLKTRMPQPTRRAAPSGSGRPTGSKSSRIKSCQVKWKRVKSSRVKSSRVESSQVESSRVKSSQVESSRVKSSQVESSRVKSTRVDASRRELSQASLNGVAVLLAATQPRWGLRISIGPKPCSAVVQRRVLVTRPQGQLSFR